MAWPNSMHSTALRGISPSNSTWFTCQGFSARGTGPAYADALLECAEFVLAPWDLNGENPNPDLRADVVNNSWSIGQGQWWFNQVIYAWRAAGAFSAFASVPPASRASKTSPRKIQTFTPMMP